MEDSIAEEISNADSSQMSATELQKALGFQRSNISAILNNSVKFVKSEKIGKAQYYGLRSQQT